MKSSMTGKLEEGNDREFPHLICCGDNVVFVDNAACGCVVFGPDLGKSFGDCELEWHNFPLFKGIITLGND